MSKVPYTTTGVGRYLMGCIRSDWLDPFGSDFLFSYGFGTIFVPEIDAKNEGSSSIGIS